MTPVTSNRRGRRLMAEINVVPYIDVMLVLLIIFMITAPLLNLGVDIELPQSNARAVQGKTDPIVVSVDSAGGFVLALQGGSGDKENVDAAALVAKVGAIVGQNPDVAVFVAGDGKASYETVYQAMVLLQQAGVTRIGLMSKPPEGGH
jgi:biopolymer transport protein TolR